MLWSIMLSKIRNIKAEFSSGGSSKFKRKLSFYENLKSENYGDSISDSIKLSPAALLFLNLDIYLDEFSKQSQEEFFLKFNIKDYHFETKVNIPQIIHANNQLYEVFKAEKLNGALYKSVLNLLVFPGLINLNNIKEELTLNSFDVVFNRIRNLNLGSPLERTESFAIKNLLDGVKQNFIYEFAKINSVVLTFIDASTGSNLIKKVSKLRTEDFPLIVDKVSSIKK